jgi:hypothetical protein
MAERKEGVGVGSGGQKIKPCDAQLDLLFCFISSFILYGILFYKEKYGGSTFYAFLYEKNTTTYPYENIFLDLYRIRR